MGDPQVIRINSTPRSDVNCRMKGERHAAYTTTRRKSRKTKEKKFGDRSLGNVSWMHRKRRKYLCHTYFYFPHPCPIYLHSDRKSSSPHTLLCINVMPTPASCPPQNSHDFPPNAAGCLTNIEEQVPRRPLHWAAKHRCTLRKKRFTHLESCSFGIVFFALQFSIRLALLYARV